MAGSVLSHHAGAVGVVFSSGVPGGRGDDTHLAQGRVATIPYPAADQCHRGSVCSSSGSALRSLSSKRTRVRRVTCEKAVTAGKKHAVGQTSSVPRSSARPSAADIPRHTAFGGQPLRESRRAGDIIDTGVGQRHLAGGAEQTHAERALRSSAIWRDGGQRHIQRRCCRRHAADSVTFASNAPALKRSKIIPVSRKKMIVGIAVLSFYGGRVRSRLAKVIARSGGSMPRDFLDIAIRLM